MSAPVKTPNLTLQSSTSGGYVVNLLDEYNFHLPLGPIQPFVYEPWWHCWPSVSLRFLTALRKPLPLNHQQISLYRLAW